MAGTMDTVNVLCLSCKCITPATRSGRCPDCRLAHQRSLENHPSRRTAKALRYNQEHRRLRAAYANAMAWGTAFACARCGQPITGEFHLDHVDGGSYPSHPYCNTSARSNP